MRYFKFVILLGLAAIVPAPPVSAAQTAATASRGVPPDFASSAKARVNYYRAMANLPPIVEDSALSAGALNHAKYLVNNGIAGGDIVLDDGQLRISAPQDAYRWEVKGQPFYTDDGASAGRNAVVIAAPKIDVSGAEFIDRLMTMPFDGLIPDGSAAFDRRTRRLLRFQPLRDRDSVSLGAGEIGAYRAL